MHGRTHGEAELEQLLEQMDQAIYDGVMTRRRVRPVHVRPSQTAAAIDVDRAVRLNRHFRQSLGWHTHSLRIARLLGLTSFAANEQHFAEAVARWQQRQSGLAVDGVIGPNTWGRMRTAIGPVPAIDVDRAVRLNRYYRQSLGWQAYAYSIVRLVGLTTGRPDEGEFAEAVARWQRIQGGLIVDGIIGPKTLARMRPVLEDLTFLDPAGPGRALAIQELPNDPVLMRQLQREFEYESAEEADRFVVNTLITPEGHERLTRSAATGLPGITMRDLIALRDGVTRVDGDLLKVFDPGEQRRHTLRRTLCQPVRDALSEARNHLVFLHSNALSAPSRQIAFEQIGEALHLIQDSYSDAHMERDGLATGARVITFPAPITYIRFFGLKGKRAPIEHRVAPPPDPRDRIMAGGLLTPHAEASKIASREFLEMMLRHLPGPPTAPKSADLRTFMDRHLLLSPHHTPTRFFYPTCPP